MKAKQKTSIIMKEDCIMKKGKWKMITNKAQLYFVIFISRYVIYQALKMSFEHELYSNF